MMFYSSIFLHRYGIVCCLFLATATSFLTSFLIYPKHHRYNNHNNPQLWMAIAPFKQPRPQNTPGNLYVDHSCIDCDVCRWIAPKVYNRIGIQSAVVKQPSNDVEKFQAYSAMAACPVGSIRLYKPDNIMKQIVDGAFPAEIDPNRVPGVYHMGYHSKESYGATSYLIRSEDSNVTVMIDVPRYHSKLADVVEEEFGGIDLCIMTHRDNIPFHDRWKQRFPNMQRVIHRLDASMETNMCEIILKGIGPWEPTSDIKIIHTPGHTAGSISILFKSPKESVLFTGDHIAYSDTRKGLEGFKRYNQGNVNVQENSIRMLADEEYPFLWVMPGHGRMVRFLDLKEKKKLFLDAATNFAKEDEWMGKLGMGYS